MAPLYFYYSGFDRTDIYAANHFTGLLHIFIGHNGAHHTRGQTIFDTYYHILLIHLLTSSPRIFLLSFNIFGLETPRHPGVGLARALTAFIFILQGISCYQPVNYLGGILHKFGADFLRDALLHCFTEFGIVINVETQQITADNRAMTGFELPDELLYRFKCFGMRL